VGSSERGGRGLDDSFSHGKDSSGLSVEDTRLVAKSGIMVIDCIKGVSPEVAMFTSVEHAQIRG